MRNKVQYMVEEKSNIKNSYREVSICSYPSVSCHEAPYVLPPVQSVESSTDYQKAASGLCYVARVGGLGSSPIHFLHSVFLFCSSI